MKKIVLIIIAIGITVGCKKKVKEEDPTATIPPAVVVPSAPVFLINIPGDADGVIMSSQTPFEFSNSYVTQLGSASAFFYTAPGNYNYVDAGVVKCNDSVLVKQSSGVYLFSGKAINGQPLSGINYGSGSTWTISGSTSVPSFTYANVSFPTLAALTSATVISKTSSYLATFSGALNADSVVVTISGDSTNLQKITVGATSGSCNFTAAQIGSVKKYGSTNYPFIGLVAFKMQANTVSGKKYYMVNSINASYKVNIN